MTQIVFDQFVILSRSDQREEAAACFNRRMRDVMAESGVISKEIRRIFQRVREIIDEDRNRTRPRTLPWGTPTLTGRGDERVPLRATRWL